MPNTLTTIFRTVPSTEPAEAPHPNTGVYVTGTQLADGTWQVVHTAITKTASPLTMVGRMKNFPAITASIVASGNILNIQQAAPTGVSAVGNTTTSISVTGNSSANATAYRFLSSAAQAGPFTLLITQTGATYNHTGLTAGQVVWYQMQYVGGGFVDDSPVSAAFSGTAATVALPKLFLVIGNSIQAYGWDASGNHIITRSGIATAACNRPGDFFFSRVTNAGALLIVLGYPGYAWDEWSLPAPGKNGINFQQEFTDVMTQYGPTGTSPHDVTALLAFGENGFDRLTAVQQINAGVAGINIVKGKGISKIVMMPTVNRTDTFQNTVDPAHPYLEVKNQFDAYFVTNAAALAIQVGPKVPAADIYADAYPGTALLCLDQVHPTLIGGKHMARSIAAGAQLYNDVTLSAELADPAAPAGAVLAPMFALVASETVASGTATGNGGISAFSGVAVSTQQLTGLGVLRWVVGTFSNGAMVGIAASRTALGLNSQLAVGVYHDKGDLTPNQNGATTTLYNAGVSGVNRAKLISGDILDFVLTATSGSSTTYQCQVNVNGTAFGAAQVIPAAAYFLSTAHSALASATAYTVAGPLAANPLATGTAVAQPSVRTSAPVLYTLGTGTAAQNAATQSLSSAGGTAWAAIGLGTLLASGNCRLDVLTAAPSVGGFIFGFTSAGAVAANYTDIAYGFYADNSLSWGVIENGTFKYGPAASIGGQNNLSGSSIISIVVTGTSVSYLIGGVSKYTSLTAVTGALRPKVALNGAGAGFANLLLSADTTAAG